MAEHHEQGSVVIRRVLVTGASGLIGGLLMRGLAGKFDMCGLDLQADVANRVFAADVRDSAQIASVFDRVGRIDCIVHLAMAQRVDPETVLRTNIEGTRNVYEAARTHGIGRVVFASTNQVSGGYERSARRDGLPFESVLVKYPVRPLDLYATTKVAGEALARQYFEVHDIESICLRIGTVLADDDPSVDPRFMRTWLSHRDVVHLFERSIVADVPFGIYWGVSGNSARFWSLVEAQDDLGYRPTRDSSRMEPGATPSELARWQGSPRRTLSAIVAALKRTVRRHWPVLTEQVVGLYRTPERRSSVSPNISDLVTINIQKGVVLEVYWVDLEHEGGPAASVFVGAEEVLRLDCFGGRSGHLHVNQRQQAGRRSRMYFPEGTIEDHIARAAFELERNLQWCVDKNMLPRINRVSVDATALVAAADWMKQRMLELVEKRADRDWRATSESARAVRRASSP
jgi:nucleoside-diphosphate-sugar epimerase